ncbi:hypothetical protein BJX76DRAFT_368827 [Aspergillus varians]
MKGHENQGDANDDGINIASEPIMHEASVEEPSDPDHCVRTRNNAIIQYLLKGVPEFQRLYQLSGWDDPACKQYFENQRRNADHPDTKTTDHFHKMMPQIATDMSRYTGIFQIKDSSPDQHSILDMCMAPGGFLSTALKPNPEAQVLACTLPPGEGGYDVSTDILENPNITTNFLDITMLVADIGTPPATIRGGQVLRSNIHNRPGHRGQGEATRLSLAQLVLALTHLKRGGTMVVLLHKFASVRLFKPSRFHAKRSSFYMLAKDVRTDGGEVVMIIERWKRIWKLARFEVGMNDDVYREAISESGPKLELEAVNVA